MLRTISLRHMHLLPARAGVRVVFVCVGGGEVKWVVFSCVSGADVLGVVR